MSKCINKSMQDILSDNDKSIFNKLIGLLCDDEDLARRVAKDIDMDEEEFLDWINNLEF